MKNLIVLSAVLCISRITSAVDYHGYGGGGGFGGNYGHDDGLFKGYGNGYGGYGSGYGGYGNGYGGYGNGYGNGYNGYGGPAVFYGYGGNGIGYGGHGGYGIGYGGHGGGYGGNGYGKGYGGLGHGGYYGNGGHYGLGGGFSKGHGGLDGYYGGHKGYGGDGGYYGGNGGNAHYKFGYGVHDPHTNDVKSQQEYRKGDHVTGSYALKEPDGTERVVKYRSGPHSGFEATVERVGVAHHPARYGHGDKGYDLGDGVGGTSYVSVTNWGDQGQDHHGYH